MPETRTASEIPTTKLPLAARPPAAARPNGNPTQQDWTPGTERRPVLPVVAVLLVLVPAVYVAADFLPGSLGPGIGMVALGLGAALALYTLNRPVLAVGLLLVTTFFLAALKELELPDPGLMVLILVVAAGAVGVGRRAHRAPSFGLVEGAMAIYVLWNIGSALAPHPYQAGGALNIGESYTVYNFILTGTATPFVIYVIGRFVFDRVEAVRAFIWIVMAIFAYSIWVSYAQFYAKPLVWPRYILDYRPEESWAGRAVGVFGQPVGNGLLLIVGFLLAVHLFHQADTRRWQRVVLAVLAATSLYAIYLTHTRVVWLSFLLAIVAGAILLPRYRRVLGTVCLMVGVGAAAGWSVLLSADRAAGGITSSYEIEDRLNMIATALWAIPQKPLFGWGIGTFAQVNTYHHQQWSPSVPWIRGYGIVSHLTELGIAAELGLIGLVLWLAVLGLVGRALWRAVRTLPDDRTLVGREFGIIAAIVAGIWFVTGLTADTRFFVFMGVLVYLLVGMTVGTAERHVARSRPARRPLERALPAGAAS